MHRQRSPQGGASRLALCGTTGEITITTVASDVAFPVASFLLHEETKRAVEIKIPKKNLFIFILFYNFVTNLTYGNLRLYLYTFF